MKVMFLKPKTLVLTLPRLHVHVLHVLEGRWALATPPIENGDNVIQPVG